MCIRDRHIFHDFFKAGEQAAAEFNIHEHAKRGQHFKDWFCPDSMEFAADHFKLDARYGRVDVYKRQGQTAFTPLKIWNTVSANTVLPQRA